MKTRTLFILLFCMGIFGTTLSQADTSLSVIPGLSLGLDHLDYPVDSSRFRMISAGRISRSLEELPLSVYVVTHEEILRNQYTTLSDVLNALPGFLVSRPGTGELGESFQIWNFTGNLYTKILINGMPVKPSVVSGMPLGSQLPIRQADRIEIIYGNSSAIYGADAVSGVINIVLKEADRGSFARGDISLGSNANNYINFTIGGKGGKNDKILEYSFYGSKFEQANMNLDYSEEGLYNPMNYYQAIGRTIEVGGEAMAPVDIDASTLEKASVSEADFIREYYGENYEGTVTMPDMEALGSAAHMLGLQLDYKGFSLGYHYMYRRTHSSLGLSPVFYKYNNPQNYWGESIQQLSMSYVRDFNLFTSTTQLNALSYSMDNNSSQGITFIPASDKFYRYSASNDIEISQIFTASPFRNSDLVAGMSYTQSGNLPTTNYLDVPFDKTLYSPFQRRMDTTAMNAFSKFGLNPIVFSNIGGFVQFYYSWKKFRFLGGMRYDVNTEYGNRFSPQLAVSHKTTRRATFRLSLGTAYKAPPASLKYQSLAYPTGEGIYFIAVPNSSLQPERFNTTEVGFNILFSKRFSLEQTFFYYRITNHIIPTRIPSTLFSLDNIVSDSIGMWVNFAESFSNVGGSQTTLRFKNIVQSIHLNAEVNLYFQARRDRLPNVQELVKDYFTLTPTHSGKLKVSMEPADNLYLYLESHWMSKWLRILIPFEEIYSELFGSTDGYYAMNGTVRYNLSDQLSAFVKVTNIFDEKYGNINATLLEENLVYNPQLRRTIRAGLSYRFN